MQNLPAFDLEGKLLEVSRLAVLSRLIGKSSKVIEGYEVLTPRGVKLTMSKEELIDYMLKYGSANAKLIKRYDTPTISGILKSIPSKTV